jgi:hypothetical protein
MALSSKTITYTGGPQVFNIAFALGVLETDHLSVQVVGDVDGFGDPIEYAFTYDPNTGDVTVTDTLTVNDVVYISRTTPIDVLLVDFEAGADVSRRNIDRAVKQALMVTQEASDARAEDAATVQELSELYATIPADVAAAEAAAATATAQALASAASAAAALAKENSMLDDAGDWLTATLYTPSQIYTYDGTAYITLVSHTSTSVAADLSSGKVRVFVAKGAAGPGSGDMLNSDNLSGLVSKPTARNNLGVAIGSQVQAWNAKLDQLAAPAYVRGDLIRSGAASLERIAIGAAGKVFISDGVDPVWGDSPDWKNVWHPYNMVTPGDGNTGRFYNNTFTASIAGPSLDAGYDYIIRGIGISHNVNNLNSQQRFTVNGVASSLVIGGNSGASRSVNFWAQLESPKVANWPKGATGFYRIDNGSNNAPFTISFANNATTVDSLTFTWVNEDSGGGTASYDAGELFLYRRKTLIL